MTREIVASIVAEVGYGPDAAKGMRNSVRANLQYLVKQSGTVVKGWRECRSALVFEIIKAEGPSSCGDQSPSAAA
jgi:hypothetical protein